MSIKLETFKPMHPRPQQDLETQLRDASRLYEKQFLGEMVKAMRATVSHTNEPSMAERIYSDKIYEQYVDAWSEQGGVGLADIIYGQLRERFYPENNHLQRPQGPLPFEQGTRIKIDETREMGRPFPASGASETPGMSYLFEFEPSAGRAVSAPWNGRVEQVIQNEERFAIRLAHENGLASTLSFRGAAGHFNEGQEVVSGQKLGVLAPDASGLTWQVSTERPRS